jgi:hypothetical protein
MYEYRIHKLAFPGTSKRLTAKASQMLEIKPHQGRIDFSQHPDKIGKVINSSIIICAKTCIPRGRETNASGSTILKPSKTNENALEKEHNTLLK